MQMKEGEKVIKNENYFSMNIFAVGFEKCMLSMKKKNNKSFKQVIAVQKITPPTLGLLGALLRHGCSVPDSANAAH